MNDIRINTIFLHKFNFKRIVIFAIVLGISFFNTFSQVIDNSLVRKDIGKTNNIDTVPPDVIWNQLPDGTVNGYVTDMPDDDNIRSNLGGIYPGAPVNYIFLYDSIVPGKTRKTTFQLQVINKFSDAAANIDFKDWSEKSNTKTISIRYFAPKFRMSPPAYSFFDVVTGQKLLTEFLIINESYTHTFPVSEIKLKQGDQGFKINLKNENGYLGGMPRFLSPRDSVLVQVEFRADKEGFFLDSIGIGNGAVFSFMSQLSANVLSPVIVAEDYDFFDVTRGDTIVKQLYVRNSSNKVDLILTGYSAVRHPFRTDLPQISESQPLILQPGFQLNFNIYFTPDSVMDYQDSILFSSNATVGDPIARLYGKGVKPGLMVTSFDWLRRRIDRPDRPELPPVAPYTDNKAIWIENTTEDTIEIFDVVHLDIEKGYAFEYGKGDFPKYLAPRDPKYIEISFHPTEVGYHEAKINFETSIGNEAFSVLKGIGIAPKIETSDMDFGTTTMGDYYSPNSRKVVFKNVRWEYEDLLEIKNLIVLPNGNEISDAVSNSSNTWGSEGFKIYFKNKNDNPLVLNPGDSLALDINFTAQKEGMAYAELRSFSDAIIDTVSKFTGVGLYRGLKYEIEEGSICINDIDTLECKLIHYGFEDIVVDSMSIEGSKNFEVVTDSLLNGFIVLAGETKAFPIIYSPSIVSSDSATLRVFYQIDSIPKETKVRLIGHSFHTLRTVSTHIPNEKNIFGLDNEFKIRIMLDYGEDISNYRIGEIALRLEYNTNFLEFQEDIDQRGDLLKGKFKVPEVIEKNIEKGYLILNCKKVSDTYLSGEGELFELTFKTKRPTFPDSIYRSAIIPFISTVGNHCIDFHNSNDIVVEINQSITDYLNWLDFNPEHNELYEVRPNPAINQNPKLSFQITAEDKYRISIFNNKGQEVLVLFNNYLTSGTYDIIIPYEDLASGSYICVLNSVKFSAYKKFIICK